MLAQYVATQSSSNVCSDAAWSQGWIAISLSYLLRGFSRSFPQGYTQVTYPQKARGERQSAAPTRVEKRDRRLTCLRASRAFSQYPCLSLWQHVDQTIPPQLKNLWLSIPCPSRSSLHFPASITDQTSGRAVAPVPLHQIPFHRVRHHGVTLRAIPTQGGA